MRNVCLLLCLVFVAAPLSASPKSGFSKERLVRIDHALDKLVAESKLAGGVLLVLHDGKPAYERVFGFRDKESGAKMQRDTIFRIASQTKAVVSAATLILVEEGKLHLSDPVSRYIPSFAKTTVRGADGKDVPAKREITIKDLLTHTSGIPYGMDTKIAPLYREKNLEFADASVEMVLVGNDETICMAMERLGTLPFVAQPGEAFVYGFNIDVLGCVIERVSGVALDKFLEARVTKPLKMKDTEFFLDKSKTARLATIYKYGDDGKIVRGTAVGAGHGAFVDGPRKAFSGGAGLLSTAGDYARFLEMVRRGGELDGVRILSPRMAALMHTDQTNGIYTPGLGFGLGFEVTKQFGARGMESAGSFGWAGAYGSVYRVDPKSRLTIVFMTQQLPYMKTAEIKELVMTEVYQALMESP